MRLGDDCREYVILGIKSFNYFILAFESLRNNDRSTGRYLAKNGVIK